MCGPRQCVNERRNGCVDRVSVGMSGGMGMWTELVWERVEEWVCGPSECVNEWRNGCVDRMNV